MTAKTCTLLLIFLALAASNLAGAAPTDDKQWDASDNTNFLVQVTHVVSLTRYVNGQLSTQKTTRDEIARCCKECVNLDGQHYYDGIPALNRTVANACAKLSPVGTTTYVSHTYEYLCKKRGFPWPNVKEVVPANYRLTHQADGIHIGLKVRLNITKNVSHDLAEIMFAKTQACVPFIKKVWANYGITFDLNFEPDNKRTPGKPDAETEIKDSEGRSFSDAYDFRPPGTGDCLAKSLGKYDTVESRAADCEKKRQEKYCARLLHETGHLLGFGDEYEDKELCPDRDLVTTRLFPFSPMGYDIVGFDFMDFYPDHLRQVIGPICR